MRRREFVFAAGRALAAGVVMGRVSRQKRTSDIVQTGVAAGSSSPGVPLNAAAYHATRRHVKTRGGNVAYIERGTGDAVLFLHGLPLNGLQWRGAIDRLLTTRRCVAPDFLGLGYSELGDGQSVAPGAQVAMLVELMDKLAIKTADVIASDSGGAIAQLLATRHRDRVRTLLLTNCDVEPDSPPAAIRPILAMAHDGTLIEKLTAPWLADKARCRKEFGGLVYGNPAHLTDDVIDYYFAPVLSTPKRRAEFVAYHLALEVNPLAGVEAALQQCTVPTRIVWGMADTIFSPLSPDYLDRTLPNSRGVRRIADGKLFFPEEYPHVIAEEARRLWSPPR
ncbi:MAG: alpha/beta hydrolase [Gemmatimonadota bacterium]